jgi:beta-1,4-mannooligosaccharide/beta-1,4-mannosyl-N-acetylglucosamine phosphorylase
MSCFHTNPIVKRFSGNPLLTRVNVPYPATLVFNAGVAYFNGKYVCMFRNDYGEWNNPVFDGTNLGLATSTDGIYWQVSSRPVWSLEDVKRDAAALFPDQSAEQEILRVYDPRLTVIDEQCYLCFALDTRHGLRGGIACTDDFSHFEVLSLSVPDNRNMVLFPEKVDGKYVRLERPMPVYSRGNGDCFDIWCSDSPDLKYWGNSHCVLGVEHVPFVNDKIGPAAPPVKTEYGWLTLFHAVDRDPMRGKNGWEDTWQKRYSIGVMLLDLEKPYHVVGMSKLPLMVPETEYERNGFRNDVLFPGGMILEPNGEVKIYYGAADTVECLATANVDDLLKLCCDRP